MDNVEKANGNGHLSGSNLAAVLGSGQFAVTGELGPPKGWQREVIEEKGHLLIGNVDAVNLTDNQTAIVRMSSVGAGVLAMGEGLEPVLQMTCRDRNRLAMQADLLGAWALGLRNPWRISFDQQTGDLFIADVGQNRGATAHIELRPLHAAQVAAEVDGVADDAAE